MISTDKKSILCIVPLPPPITGAAAASESIVSHLKKHHNVTVMPYQRGNLVSGEFSLKQLIKFLHIGTRMTIKRNSFDCAYLVISSSTWGNPRDLFLLALMGQQLQKKTVLHLHGSNIDTYLKKSSLYIKILNKLMLSQVNSSIVLGETFRNIFDDYIPSNKIEIVKNFFDPSLLIHEVNIEEKFNTFKKVNILFLSNLIKEKGYLLLLDAFLSLPPNIRSKATLHYAGEVKSEKEKTSFLKIIKNTENIFYHGPVDGQKKRELFWNAQVFCLPTLYKYEGQPISIIESYAAGCVVLTIDNGGISDIFTNGYNGFFIDINIETSNRNENIFKIKNMLETLIPNIGIYKEIASFNRREALNKYSETFYCNTIEKILIKAAE